MTTLRQYAVLDFETTGYGSTDRIIEIGVVLLNHHREVEKTWETLVQPQRDISNSFVHHITASDVVGAPTFAEVAGELASLLSGRTLVAHNASFEARFLHHEYKRLGLAWPQMGAWIIDTQRLFRQQYPGEKATLAHAVERAGITNSRPHSALADSLATAQLFSALATDGPNVVLSAAPLSLPSFTYPAGGALLPRAAAEGHDKKRNGEWLARISGSLSRSEHGSVGAYRKTLTAALADRELSNSEIEQLSQQAHADGLSRDDLLSIHEEFIRQLAVEAWLDGVITDEERETLSVLNDELGLPPELVEELLASPQEGDCSLGLTLHAGDRVSFTGQLDLPREEWEKRATAVGLSTGGVTKKSALLVAANPDSMSGKAQKARSYGIPVVGEKTFAQLVSSMDGSQTSEDTTLSAPEPSEEPTALPSIFAWSESASVDGTNSTQLLAREWCDQHPTEPLVDISAHLTPTTPLEVHNSFKSAHVQWLRRFPEPLSATVQDLKDLSGVGQHKLLALVEAVILAAIDGFNSEMADDIESFTDVYGDDPVSERLDEFVGLTEDAPSVSADEFDIYLGWVQLVHDDAKLPEVPAAIAAHTHDVMRHLESAKPLKALFQRAADDVWKATEGDERKTVIVKKRWLGGATLEELGADFGVTRERIRQLENQWRRQLDATGGLFHAVVKALLQRMAPVTSVESVRAEMPELLQPAAGWDCSFGELFTAVGKKWEIADGWISVPGFEDTLMATLENMADEYGVVGLSELAESLEVTPALIEEYIVTHEKLRVVIVDNWVLTKVGSYQDRAVSALAISGEPMTSKEIMDVMGGGNPRTASNQFSVDPRLIKVSADQWALAEWGIEEFTTIATWIETRLVASPHTYALSADEPDGSDVSDSPATVDVQAVPLDELVAEADRLRVAETSIRQYADSGDFETRDGMVFKRVDESANVVEGDIEDTRDVYLKDDSWHLLLTVNKDHLRGSGFQVPLGIAAYYGLKVNDSVALTSRMGDQYVRVNRLKQASMSTIKRFLDELGVRAGDRVWLKLGEDKTFDVTRAQDVHEGLSGLDALYDFVGLDPALLDPAESIEDSLARVNELLGLRPTAPRRRTVATFRHRRQDDMADLIQDL